jgi:hypothetical protein
MVEHYIGVDLHKAFCKGCAVDAFGARCWEDRFATTAARASPRFSAVWLFFRGTSDTDLGSVSAQWIAEQRKRK